MQCQTKPPDEVLHNPYSLPNAIRRMNWGAYATRMEYAYKFLIGKPERTRKLGRQDYR